MQAPEIQQVVTQAVQSGIMPTISSGTMVAGILVALFKEQIKSVAGKMFKNGNGHSKTSLDKSSIENAQHIKDTVDDTKKIVIALADDSHKVMIALTEIAANTRGN